MPGLPDEEIIRRVVAGDADLFEELLMRYQEHVGRIVAGHVPRDMVEEVAHDVFVRAYVSLPSYSFRTPFSHWLSTIAVRTCYDAWKTVSARKEVPLSGPRDVGEGQQQWIEHPGRALTRWCGNGMRPICCSARWHNCRRRIGRS
jgi:DNA-directed RNA polymerase specialized sigma24 family protein